MRIIVQVVEKASVEIKGQIHASISKGFLLFVGFTHTDNEIVIDKMVDKLLKLRIFPDENGKTNLGLSQVNAEILSVSQFTLYADVRGGNRPSFTRSLNGQNSEKLYGYFNEKIATLGYDIKTGVFGADMSVNLTNEGPFTLLLDSEELYG